MSPERLQLQIITIGLTNGNVGSAYFAQLEGLGGYTPYDWSIGGGILPPGLTIDNSGFISGVPTTPGIYTVNILLTDAVSDSDSRIFDIEITGPTSPDITTTTISNGMVSVPYSQTPIATGGVTPYTWAISTGTIPPGLTINNATGEISGTPTTPGTYTFTIEVTDVNSNTDIQGFGITISGINPIINSVVLPTAIVSTSYTTTVTASSGTPPYSNWQVLSGSLPPGLTITSGASAVISGVPITAGTYNFTLEVSDSLTLTDTEIFTIIVLATNTPTITTTSLSNGTLNSVYSQTLTAVGGVGAYIWSISSGSLPSGITLNSSTGVISGTPTAIGTFNIGVTVSDANGNTDTKTYVIYIGNNAIPSITTTSISNGTVSSSYSQFVSAVDGSLPYTWSNIGALPPGLVINSLTGEISGTPTTAGTYTFDIRVTDGNSNIDTQSYTISIGIVGSPIILTNSLPNGVQNSPYSTTIVGGSGTTPYVWSINSGVLPPGLSLNTTTGIISGIPTAIGSYNFQVGLTDAGALIDNQDFSITITGISQDTTCCFCVFSDEIIEFETNASNGTLTANGGLIISNRKWMAPPTAGTYIITMTAGSNSTTNTVRVIEKLKLTNSTNVIRDLLPGDSFQLITNYDASQVTWKTLDCDVPVVTEGGMIFINTSATDKCFGGLECNIRGYLNDLSGCALVSVVDVKIIVEPVYPTPEFCGPNIVKWLKEGPKYREIITEFEGGCVETHIKNPNPTLTWSINYQGINNYIVTDSVCPNCTTSSQICGCENNDAFGCPATLRASNRIDDFYNYVQGRYKPFTLVDHDTGEVWYNVRFDSEISVDHRHRRTATVRTVKLIWRPCCSKLNIGGACAKHGITNYKKPTTTIKNC